MRKLTVLISILLIFSGLLITYPSLYPFGDYKKLLLLIHIWLGCFFLVIFPMYAWDHIKTNKKYLKTFNMKSISGASQFFVGLILILSGIVLLLYNSNSLIISRYIHEIFTYLIVLTFIIHSISKRFF